MAEDTPDLRQATGGKTRAGRLRLLSLDNLDKRTAAARRAVEIVEALESDLGGDRHVTTGERALARRAGVLVALLESTETVLLSGGKADMGEYLMATNTLRRLLATIGLERRQRDVTPSLATYIEGKA